MLRLRDWSYRAVIILWERQALILTGTRCTRGDMKQGPCRAVFFDVGGVICRCVDQSYRTVWEERLGLAPGELARTVLDSEISALATRGLITEGEAWDMVGSVYELSRKDLGVLRSDFWHGTIADQRLLDVIRRLAQRCRIGIVSNCWSEGRATFNRVFGMHALSEVCILSAEVGLAKPDTAIFDLCSREIGVARADMILVDDSPVNVRSAQDWGMNAVLFTNREQAIRDVCMILPSVSIGGCG